MTPVPENFSGAGVFVVGTGGQTPVPEKVCVAALPKKRNLKS